MMRVLGVECEKTYVPCRNRAVGVELSMDKTERYVGREDG